MLLALAGGGALLSPARAACPDRPPCKGCGCKGGPGYRGADGRCVGFANLPAICGTPPTTRCTFENTPGTGENRARASGQESRAGAAKPAAPLPGTEALREDVE